MKKFECINKYTFIIYSKYIYCINIEKKYDFLTHRRTCAGDQLIETRHARALPGG